MSQASFDTSARTLQVGFYPAVFQFSGEEFRPVGTYVWTLAETGAFGDGAFRVGETLALAPTDYLGYYAAQDLRSVTYLGTVDISGDGFVDGVVVDEGFGELILTDLDPWIGYQPYGSRVTLSQRSYFLPVVLPPDPDAPTAGDDILWGTDSAETVRLLAGDDQFFARGGNDRVHGGAGRDDIGGGDGDDRLFGGGGADVVTGDGGHDLVKGNAGADHLGLGSGDDWCFGGAGGDRIAGGAGDDVILGNRGNDALLGGTGADVFAFRRGDGRDIVSDFRPGQDLIGILSGASRFEQLHFQKLPGGVVVQFADVAIGVEGVSLSALDDPGNFLF